LTGNVARMGEMGSTCKILIGKPGGKRSRRQPTVIWEDNFSLDVRK